MKMNPDHHDCEDTPVGRVGTLPPNVNESQDKLWHFKVAKHRERSLSVFVNLGPRLGRCSDLLVLRQAGALAAPVEVANVCSPR